MTPMDDFLAEVNGRAIIAFLRACGGQGTVHARLFDLKPGECSRAVRRLHRAGRIERMGDCVWRVVE